MRPLLRKPPRKKMFQGVDGILDHAMTDRGHEVEVWSSVYEGVGKYTHFCHGYSLGTFRNYGFSVLGGSNMEVLLNDEYYPIDAFQIRRGDIVVFRGNLTGVTKGITHSALVEGFTSDPYKATRLDTLYVSSKSSFEDIHPMHKLSEEVEKWGLEFSFYRKR